MDFTRHKAGTFELTKTENSRRDIAFNRWRYFRVNSEAHQFAMYPKLTQLAGNATAVAIIGWDH